MLTKDTFYNRKHDILCDYASNDSFRQMKIYLTLRTHDRALPFQNFGK